MQTFRYQVLCISYNSSRWFFFKLATIPSYLLLTTRMGSSGWRGHSSTCRPLDTKFWVSATIHPVFFFPIATIPSYLLLTTRMGTSGWHGHSSTCRPLDTKFWVSATVQVFFFLNSYYTFLSFTHYKNGQLWLAWPFINMQAFRYQVLCISYNSSSFLFFSNSYYTYLSFTHYKNGHLWLAWPFINMQTFRYQVLCYQLQFIKLLFF